MSQDNRGCEHEVVEVTQKDLPMCCPRHGERVWDAHPRVYMPTEEKMRCPYCGTIYVLI